MSSEEFEKSEHLALHLAFEIAEFLKKNCPAFKFEPSGSPYGKAGAVWHGCNCAVLGSSCICVWHSTNKCQEGEWNMPFVKATEQLGKAKQVAAKNVMSSVLPTILKRAEG